MEEIRNAIQTRNQHMCRPKFVVKPRPKKVFWLRISVISQGAQHSSMNCRVGTRGVQISSTEDSDLRQPNTNCSLGSRRSNARNWKQVFHLQRRRLLLPGGNGWFRRCLPVKISNVFIVAIVNFSGPSRFHFRPRIL